VCKDGHCECPEALVEAPVTPVTQFEERNIDQVKAALADILAKLQNA
jgi:hypothetical protein